MKDEALRQVDEIAAAVLEAAAVEIRRLHADAEESEALRERLSALLTSTAIALRGPAPELVSWSWHDLPERAAALVAQRDALLEALKKAEENGCATVYDNEYDECGAKGCCGVVSYKPHADDCWVTTARAAIKAVEEGK